MHSKSISLVLVVLSSLACLTTGQSQQAPAGTAGSGDMAALQAEVERLRSIMPGQAFAMTQVAYNYSNLWFAAHAENWQLAQFYLNETRVRLRWAMRITPTRKISSGDIQLGPLLESLETTTFASLEQSVASKDIPRFESSYSAVLNSCYGCHTASEKPYLRLHIPTDPAEPLIDFEAH
jgi:hypothetical protein